MQFWRTGLQEADMLKRCNYRTTRLEPCDLQAIGQQDVQHSSAVAVWGYVWICYGRQWKALHASTGTEEWQAYDAFDGKGVFLGTWTMDFCSGPVVVAGMVCFLSWKHQRFVGFESDILCVIKAHQAWLMLVHYNYIAPEKTQLQMILLATLCRYSLRKPTRHRPEKNTIFGMHRLDCRMCNHFLSIYFILFHTTTETLFCSEAALFPCIARLHCGQGAFTRHMRKAASLGGRW